MTVPFAQIPPTLRVPLFYAEMDASRANTASAVQKALIIGQKTSGGTLTANVAELMTSVAASRAGGGAGSNLALMAETYRLNDPFGEVWQLPLADDGAAVAATGTFAFTGPSTAAGTVYAYIGGKRVIAAVTSGMAATAVGAALAAAINLDTDLPVTAANVTGTVTATAKNAGLTGNEIDLRINFLGASGGEVLPAGVGCTVTAMASGATNPSLTTALANLQDEPFDFIVSPFTDATSLAAIKAFLNDTSGRWSWTTQIYGHVFMAYRDTAANLLTFGGTQNDQHASIMGVYGSPTPTWIWAAALAGAAAVSLVIDPGRPVNTLALQGVKAPSLANRFSLSNRNSLLFKGVSSFTVDRDGTVRIEKLITTYQTNAGGQLDDSYFSVVTLFLSMYVLRFLKNRVVTRYGRMKLAPNGTRFAPGAPIVTPNIVRADLVAAYRELEFRGLVHSAAAFEAALIVEIDPSNPRRLNVLFPAKYTPELDIFAVLNQFSLAA
jgi:phage tail sheath gpL-like